TARGFLHSHSYTGNPLACSAALATLDIFEHEQVLQNNRQKSAYIGRKLQEALRGLPVEHVRQTGMIAAFDVISSDVGFQQGFYQAALMRGLLVRPIGRTVYLMPPYIISEPEIDWMCGEIAGLLQEVLG